MQHPEEDEVPQDKQPRNIEAYSPSVNPRMPSAATTAVSVRRMFWPSDASTKSAARPSANSSSVHPPSGPIARLADGSAYTLNASRISFASRRSDRTSLQAARASAKASFGRIAPE